MPFSVKFTPKANGAKKVAVAAAREAIANAPSVKRQAALNWLAAKAAKEKAKEDAEKAAENAAALSDREKQYSAVAKILSDANACWFASTMKNKMVQALPLIPPEGHEIKRWINEAQKFDSLESVRQRLLVALNTAIAGANGQPI